MLRACRENSINVNFRVLDVSADAIYSVHRIQCSEKVVVDLLRKVEKSSNDFAYNIPSFDPILGHQTLDKLRVLFCDVRSVFLFAESWLAVPTDGETKKSPLLRDSIGYGRLAGRSDRWNRVFGKLRRHSWMTTVGRVSLTVDVAFDNICLAWTK